MTIREPAPGPPDGNRPPRTTKEWRSDNPNTMPPPKVRVRIFDRYGGRCYICDRKIQAGDKWQPDHVVAIINGGANAESNMAPACSWCHPEKTKADVAEKSKVARVRKKALGIKSGKHSRWPPKGSRPLGRGFPKRRKAG